MDDDENKLLQDATYATASTLRQLARELDSDLTRLTLPEMDDMVDAVARAIPAGNVPALILSGLTRLAGRKPNPDAARRDVNLLFQGVGSLRDKAIYSAFFAGPAAVIWGYQNLLRLAGKNPDDSFPEGTWQFYVDYALREDTARHDNETHGFDTTLNQEGIALSPVERMTAWVLTAIHALHDYDAILENEWRERIHTGTLTRLLAGEEQAGTPRLYRAWQKQLPYRRGTDAYPAERYIDYRRRKFDTFMARHLSGLTQPEIDTWQAEVAALQQSGLSAYKRQMSIKAFLQPDVYGETRTPITEWALHVGVVYQGRYYLIPAWHNGERPHAQVIRSLIAHLVYAEPETPAVPIAGLASIKRAAFAKLREALPSGFVGQLNKLRLAPILLNFDPPADDATLTQIRQGERGVGDHALTVFDTGRTFVFDQSHIFYDGTWGAAFAEIVTNEAIEWARYLAAHRAQTLPAKAPHALRLSLPPHAERLINDAPRIVPEVSVENSRVLLPALLGLRALFKQRSDLLQLTVNDILVLYRAIHAISYRPSDALLAHLPPEYHTLEALKPMSSAPAILIPVDCSPQSPRERLHPISFEVPLSVLNITGRHQAALRALAAYQGAADDRPQAFKQFNVEQKRYLTALAGFGALMSHTKTIATSGESASVSTIKLLAHMPRTLQRWLDQIPHQFDLLNDLIKGREVFSNVGKVAPGSSLTRFTAAKDDNEKKTLAWGVLTDDANVMRLSLRDFRPHVAQLIAAGHGELAQHIAQDYLNAYVDGLNTYVAELTRIALAGRRLTSSFTTTDTSPTYTAPQ